LNYQKKSENDVILSIRKVEDPKRHGITILKDESQYISNVTRVIEKPENPPTNLGIMPIYLLNDKIFSALEQIEVGKNNELQLTDAIQKIIETGGIVKSIRVDSEIFWDVGTPESYWESLNNSHRYLK